MNFALLKNYLIKMIPYELNYQNCNIKEMKYTIVKKLKTIENERKKVFYNLERTSDNILMYSFP